MKRTLLSLLMTVAMFSLIGCCTEDLSCGGTTSTQYVSCTSTAPCRSCATNTCNTGCNYGCGSYTYNNGWY